MDSNITDKLDLSNGTVKLDIYQHLKLGAQNDDKIVNVKIQWTKNIIVYLVKYLAVQNVI